MAALGETCRPTTASSSRWSASKSLDNEARAAQGDDSPLIEDQSWACTPATLRSLSAKNRPRSCSAATSDCSARKSSPGSQEGATNTCPLAMQE